MCIFIWYVKRVKELLHINQNFVSSVLSQLQSLRILIFILSFSDNTFKTSEDKGFLFLFVLHLMTIINWGQKLKEAHSGNPFSCHARTLSYII